MTALLFDGFDLDDSVHRWTVSERIVDNDPARTGTHSYSFSTGGNLYIALDPIEEDDVIYAGFGFWSLASLSAVDSVVLEFAEGFGAVSHLSLVRRPSIRGWEVRRGAATADGLNGTGLISVIPNVWFPESWHYVEMGAKIHNTAGWVELRQDGITIGRFDGDTSHTGSVDGLIDRVLFHQSGSAASSDYFIDDVYILNEQGTVNNSWLGDTRCYPLYPDGNGNYSELVGSDGNSTDNYLLVDEVGTPVTTDYVGSATAGEKDSYTFQDLPVTLGTIRGVEVRMHAAKDDTGTKQIRSVTRRSGTDSFGPDHVLAAVPLWQTHHDIQELDPHAGPGAWTITNVNDTEWGVEVRS